VTAIAKTDALNLEIIEGNVTWEDQDHLSNGIMLECVIQIANGAIAVGLCSIPGIGWGGALPIIATSVAIAIYFDEKVCAEIYKNYIEAPWQVEGREILKRVSGESALLLSGHMNPYLIKDINIRTSLIQAQEKAGHFYDEAGNYTYCPQGVTLPEELY